MIVCGVPGSTLEVVEVTAVEIGVSFTATFANAHAGGEGILGATFPVRQPTDPLVTQAEAIAYISSATNDFLTDTNMVYNVMDLTVPPTGQNTPLPADCLFPVRLAPYFTVEGPGFGEGGAGDDGFGGPPFTEFAYPLRETSQSNLDSMFFDWSQQALAPPRVYFRDKIPIQNVGIWPRQGNTVQLEVVYAQRQAQTLGWGDGFLLPDPMTVAILQKTLSFFYSKNGEISQPALAKFWASRYSISVKIAKMIMGVVNDPMTQ
jgi:hypothetical protein